MYEELVKRLRELPNLLFVQLHGHEDVVYQAADAIEELQKENLRLHAFNDANLEAREMLHERIKELTDTNVGKWIPVTERLPDTDKCVLVISYGRVCFAKLLLTENNGGYPTFVLQDGLNNPPVLETTAHNEFTENRITHWQYLPEPPKEEKDEQRRKERFRYRG